METVGVIDTRITKKEFRHYLNWASFQSNFTSILKIVLISAAAAFVLKLLVSNSWIFFAVWTAIIMAVYIGIILILNEVQVSKIDEVKNFAYLNDDAQYTFYEDRFTTDKSDSEFKYRNIRQLFSTKKLFVINYNYEKCFLLKKSDVGEDLEKIVEAIKKYSNK